MCFLFQVLYLLIRQSSLNKYLSTQEPANVNIPVSVVICARNEAENLQRFLPAFLNQKYPVFEVVLVNDCSVDDSKWILEAMEKEYSNLKIVTVTESRNFVTGKKFAVTMGIKAAKYDCLLFTDADCEPASENWISLMAAEFSNPENDIVLGYSPYHKTGGLLNAMIRFETIKTAINYLSAAVKGDAYMGVGRNMGYRKQLFFDNKGFASHMHIMSGDDDIFVNQNATSTNVAIITDHQSFTLSEPKRTFGQWIRQKRRHMGAGKMYKTRHKRLLTLDAFTGLLFYAALFVCIGNPITLYSALGMLVLRWLLQLIIYIKPFKHFWGKDLLWLMPFYDLFYYLSINVFGLMGAFGRTKKWK
ncbi:glycosyltransferase [Mucilaginibacter ginkgonis]|uniref:Glycosyltransferase n=1 Tax=Mucilaginibacter ginkgonis TaxID=2682091 RepID=A0A6I4I2K0_9SPHI|nr:glycosyltransferase [Mucilaginibacter ginkgonis]